MLLKKGGKWCKERRYDSRLAVDQRNACWCFDGLGTACDTGEKVRVAFVRLL